MSKFWAVNLSLKQCVRESDMLRLMRFISRTYTGVPLRVDTETRFDYEQRIRTWLKEKELEKE